MPYTLITSVDDCVKRNPYFGYYGMNVESTEMALARHALYGDPILIDSAYFVQNKELGSLLRTRSDNILKAMIRNRRLLIISETGSFSEDVRSKTNRPGNKENVAEKTKADDVEKDLGQANLWLNQLDKSPFIILDNNGMVPVAMRKALVSRILNINHPNELGFLSKPKIFDSFREKLIDQIKFRSARSACELTLYDNKFDESEDGKGLITDIMTYAHEAFQISMAAYLAEKENIEVNVETIPSNRFNAMIPYKSVDKNDGNNCSFEIRIGLEPIVRNKNAIIDKIFNEKDLINAREKHLKNKENEIYARYYEKIICEKMEIPCVYEIEKKFDEDYGPYIGAAITTGVGAGASLLGFYSNAIFARFERREVMGIAASFAGAFLGNTHRIVEHAIDKKLDDVGTGIVSQHASSLLVLDQVYEKGDDPDQLLGSISKLLKQRGEKFAYNQSVHFNVPVTNLQPDISSKVYRNWKNNEKIQ